LLGFLISGILLGPNLLNWIHPQFLELSSFFRQFALIVILLRAGLALKIVDLKRIGKTALLMSVLPASVEILAVTFLAPLLFPINHLQAIILGTILSAASPAVIVPKMLQMIKEGFGVKQKIPQLIMASTSLNSIYVLVLFSSFVELYLGESFSFLTFLNMPIAVFLGLVLGYLVGIVFHKLKVTNPLILLGTAFLFIELEQLLADYFPLSGMIAILTLGVVLLQKDVAIAKELSVNFSRIWEFAEILLFVFIGANLSIHLTLDYLFFTVTLLLFGLVFRAITTFISLLGTNLNDKEKLFVAFAYLPKATVQAAIGGLPLSFGIADGHIFLVVAVTAILFIAPLGSLLIECTYKKLTVND
jgi:NhaP-type Na+/H+ or K+/H+ antiporter